PGRAPCTGPGNGQQAWRVKGTADVTHFPAPARRGYDSESPTHRAVAMTGPTIRAAPTRGDILNPQEPTHHASIRPYICVRRIDRRCRNGEDRLDRSADRVHGASRPEPDP